MKNKERDLIDNLIFDWKQERPELDTSAMQIVGRLLNLGKTLEKRASLVLQDGPIHYTDLDVLATLRRSGKPYELSPTQLMDSVLITSGSMTALLDRLAKLYLIYRTTDQADKRIKRAGLTRKGIEVIDKAIEIRFNEAQESIAVFNEKEKKVLSNLLRKMTLHLKGN